MKHFFYLLSFFLMPLFAMSQSNISFKYDAAGNRILRKVVPLLRASSAQLTKSDSVVSLDTEVNEPLIAVYPNPTKGALGIKILGSKVDQKIVIKLFSAQGSHLQTVIGAEGTTPVDMNRYPAGWYLLQVWIGKKPNEIKIIKE